jgi:hypothetical protein
LHGRVSPLSTTPIEIVRLQKQQPFVYGSLEGGEDFFFRPQLDKGAPRYRIDTNVIVQGAAFCGTLSPIPPGPVIEPGP